MASGEVRGFDQEEVGYGSICGARGGRQLLCSALSGAAEVKNIYDSDSTAIKNCFSSWTLDTQDDNDATAGFR